MKLSQGKKLSKILSLPIFTMVFMDALLIIGFLQANQGTWNLIGDSGLKNTWNILFITIRPSIPPYLNWDFIWVLIIILYKDFYFFMKYYGKETKQTPSQNIPPPP
jgi:hypothetical protein